LHLHCKFHKPSQGELDWVYGIYSADVNDDGKIDVFDYIEMRKIIESSDSKLEYRFTQVDISIPVGLQYGKQPFDSEAVITSVSELENYFHPYYVMLTTGECVTVEVASQEIIDDFLSRYDKDFFRDNVLLLNYLRGTISYEFESVQYEDSTLVIKYYDTEPDVMWYQPLPPYIAEVAMSKDLWADGDVIWEEVEKPFESSFAEPQIITSSDELDT
ncbi:MAG: hypothetical protein K2I82_00595, partial [Ruminococcus sp.]|nr:hypothetical protein [Ruminococcus sp.]